MKFNRIIHIGLAIVLALGLSACATPGGGPIGTGPISAVVIASVDVATGAAIQQGSSDPTVWASRAANFRAIATDIKAVASGDGVTIAMLETDANRAIIAANLGPANTLAANALSAVVFQLINQYVDPGTGVLQGAAQMDVVAIMTQVIVACDAYTTSLRYGVRLIR